MRQAGRDFRCFGRAGTDDNRFFGTIVRLHIHESFRQVAEVLVISANKKGWSSPIGDDHPNPIKPGWLEKGSLAGLNERGNFKIMHAMQFRQGSSELFPAGTAYQRHDPECIAEHMGCDDDLALLQVRRCSSSER